MTSFEIQGSIALVTGTTRKNGIGQAIVKALIENGTTKVYATARKASQLEDLVSEYNGKVVAVSLDVTDLDAIQKLPERFPDINLIVNNAGYFTVQSSLDEISAAQTEIAVNYIAPLAIVRSFAPVFQEVRETSPETKATAIVNLNSIASIVNFAVAGTYSASKAAEHSLTQAQRRDLPKSLVVGVYPGPIDTDMAEDLPFDKTPPSAVALSVVDALKSGTEDVFPDLMAQQLHEGWKADAKAMEQQMAQPMVAQA